MLHVMRSHVRFRRTLRQARLIGPLLGLACVTTLFAAEPAVVDDPAVRIDAAPVVRSEARDVVALYRGTHRIGYGVTVPDGYLDGGRDMRVSPDGRATSTREVLTVDRRRDEVLRKALAFSGSAEVRGLPTAERMKRIAHYVSSTFETKRDRSTPFADDEALADANRGRGILLGDVPALCNTGVCRHESLLFKLMADEAGLDAALVRGGYRKEGRDRPGAHVWCEVEQDDGSFVIVDTMRSKGWFITMVDPRAANYHDVAHRPLYGPDGRRQHLAIVAASRPPFVDSATVAFDPPASATLVRYTTDGSEPSADSPSAQAPVVLSRTCVVKAVAFDVAGRVVDRASRHVVVVSTRAEGRSAPAQDRPLIATLVVDGHDNLHHDWRLSTPAIRKILESTGRFRLNVATAPADIDQLGSFRPDFKAHDLVVLNYNSDGSVSQRPDADWPRETMAAFVEFVSGGGGVVVFHSANNSFPRWREYNEIIGVGGWGNRDPAAGAYVYYKDGSLERDEAPGDKVGWHGPEYPYPVVIRQPDHPITRGLPPVWMHVRDELYSHLRGPARDVEVLATAFSADTMAGRNVHEPMMMTVRYGKGRVFHTPMGHQRAVRCAGLACIIQRGAEWAATGEVTIPVPDDFPGPDASRESSLFADEPWVWLGRK